MTRTQIINPDYVLAYELHELTQIKQIKYIGLYLDENVFREILTILLIFFGFIRVIHGLKHHLGSNQPLQAK